MSSRDLFWSKAGGSGPERHSNDFTRKLWKVYFEFFRKSKGSFESKEQGACQIGSKRTRAFFRENGLVIEWYFFVLSFLSTVSESVR